MKLADQHVCTSCERSLPIAQFFGKDAVLRTTCNLCRFRKKARSPRTLGARAKKRRAAQDVDAWWEEQARLHP